MKNLGHGCKCVVVETPLKPGVLSVWGYTILLGSGHDDWAYCGRHESDFKKVPKGSKRSLPEMESDFF